jgi:hypothetical protein
MRIFNLLKIAVGLAALTSAVVYGKDVVGMSTNQAFQVLTNFSSSTSECVTAMKSLDQVPGEISFWLKIAEDKRYDADRRRRCAEHIFLHFISKEMTLGQVNSIIGTNTDWVSYTRIRKVERDWLMGWLPYASMQGESGFAVPILSEAPGNFHLVIFISLDRDVRIEDLVNGLTGKAGRGDATNIKIAACGTWNSDDQEKKYPGSGWVWDSLPK